MARLILLCIFVVAASAAPLAWTFCDTDVASPMEIAEFVCEPAKVKPNDPFVVTVSGAVPAAEGLPHAHMALAIVWESRVIYEEERSLPVEPQTNAMSFEFDVPQGLPVEGVFTFRAMLYTNDADKTELGCVEGSMLVEW